MKTNDYPLHKPINRGRRGTIYPLVIFACLIVTTISLSSLQLMRLQGRSVSSSGDFSAAQTYARTAIEIGMLKIRNDPYWRNNLSMGNWLTDEPIGNGTMTLSAIDPVDNDIQVGENHPVILTGTGKKGEARYSLSTRMEIGPRVGTCLELSMASGRDMRISSSILTSDQSISANQNVIASDASTVNANVEASDSIIGSRFAQAKQSGSGKKTLPNPQNVLDYYIEQGTTIHYSALPQSRTVELLRNTSFESNSTGWYPKSTCLLQRSNLRAREGAHSLRVTNRSGRYDVAAQDLPVEQLRSGHSYQLSIPVAQTTYGTARAVLTLESTGDGLRTFRTPEYFSGFPLFGRFPWVNLRGEITPTWTGTLTKATIEISITTAGDYYMDNVSLIDVTYQANSYVIDGQLISPTVNPYGAPNAMGIYIIDCAGRDVMIGDSRIVGTLVFLNPGINSQIMRAVCWEAAVHNFPALLTNDLLTISTDSAGLNEANCGVNLNPAGTPWPFVGGTSNTSTTDSYPSKITGIVYSAVDLGLAESANIKGVVVAERDITVTSSSLSLSYGNTYLNDPPPGFTGGTITMKIVPGSWQRSVD